MPEFRMKVAPDTVAYADGESHKLVVEFAIPGPGREREKPAQTSPDHLISMPFAGLKWLLAGGIAYTVGMSFFLAGETNAISLLWFVWAQTIT